MKLYAATVFMMLFLLLASSQGLTQSGNDFHALQNTVREKMLMDEEILATIHSLQDDPAFRKVLQDAEITRAVREGDLETLLASPDFMKLLNNRAVQDIERRLP